MNNYSDLSDFEINHSVAEKAIDFEELIGVPMFGNAVRWGDGANWHHFNPCNSWADAGPIIVANAIDLIQDNGQGCALATPSAVMMMQGEDVYIEQDPNPLRAAMIVFLKMKESK